MKKTSVNEIIVRRVADKVTTYTDLDGKQHKRIERRYTVTTTADGKVREGFNSISDTAEWIGTMKAHGLFKGLCAWFEGPDGRQIIEPTYENECHEPTICQYAK